MKFQCLQDKKLFLIELDRLDLLDSVTETWEPSKELLEKYDDKRGNIVPKFRDFRKSQTTKQAWRHNRYNYMKGIKKFHRSTQGKRMHRTIGDFLATHEQYKGANIFKMEVLEGLKAISSFKTHCYIELQHYLPMEEYIEVSEMAESLVLLESRINDNFIKGALNIDKDDLELLYRLADEDELVSAFARKYEKPITEVKSYWNSCKNSLIESQKTESYDYFYTEVVEKVENKFAK